MMRRRGAKRCCVPTVIASFDQLNNSLGLNYTDTYHRWLLDTEDGTIQQQGGVAVFNIDIGGGVIPLIETRQADGYLQATFFGTFSLCGIVFRASDSTHYLFAGWSTSSTSLQLRRYNPTGSTITSTTANYSATGVTLGVYFSGTTIKVYVNGELKINTTYANNTANTMHGITSTYGTVDNFSFLPLPTPTSIIDNFNRPNNNVTLGFANSNQAYIPVNGVWGIESHKAKLISGTNAVAVVDTGSTERTVQGRILNNKGGLVFRYVNPTNFWFFHINGSNLNEIAAMNGGGIVPVSISGTHSDGDFVQLVCSGSIVTAYVNGVHRAALDINHSLFNAYTTQGVFGASAGALVGDFSVIPNAASNNNLLTFAGDSLTWGNGSTSPALYSYPSQVMATLGGTWDWYNMGVGGQTTAQMLAAISSVTGLIGAGARARKILCCMSGRNDSGTATESLELMRQYVVAAKAAGYQCIVLTLPSGSGAGYDAKVADYNTAMRAATWYDGLADIAADSRLGAAGAYSNTTYFADGIHLTDAGYAIVAGIAKIAIQGLP